MEHPEEMHWHGEKNKCASLLFESFCWGETAADAIDGTQSFLNNELNSGETLLIVMNGFLICIVCGEVGKRLLGVDRDPNALPLQPCYCSY